MNAHQRRKLVRKHKGLIALYKTMRRLRGLPPINKQWTDFELAKVSTQLRSMIDEWSGLHETTQ